MSNVYDSLLPLYYGTKFLGLSPFKRTENGYNASKIGSLYPIMIMLMLSVFLYCFYSDIPIIFSNDIMLVSIKHP